MFHNWVTDQDFMWWPFSFLRPAKNVPMTYKDTMLMTACFGGMAFVFFTVFAIMNNMYSFESSVMTFVSCFVGFGLWFNLITKPLWNVRAKAHAGK